MTHTSHDISESLAFFSSFALIYRKHKVTGESRRSCYLAEVLAQSFKMTCCACVVMITGFSNYSHSPSHATPPHFTPDEFSQQRN